MSKYEDKVEADPVIPGYEGALSTLDQAAALGRQLASDIDRIYFVGCGGPNRVMLSLQ